MVERMSHNFIADRIQIGTQAVVVIDVVHGSRSDMCRWSLVLLENFLLESREFFTNGFQPIVLYRMRTLFPDAHL